MVSWKVYWVPVGRVVTPERVPALAGWMTWRGAQEP
jgi:hypothetical protein